MNHCKLLLTALLFSTGFAYSQINTIDTAVAAANLKKSADNMAALFIEKDYTHYVKYINPKIVANTGGNDKMIVVLKQSMDDMKSKGVTIKNLSIGNISSIVITKAGLQSVVQELLTLKMNEGRVEAISYLIALSTDKGKTWTFIDTSGKPLAEMQKMFPSLSNELVIPEKQQPQFYKE